MKIPKSHPRYESLMTREKLVKSFEDGVTAGAGLIAHGRGEAFDYLLGEKTTKEALAAEKAAACSLLLAKNPVISVNGNVAALCPKEIVDLAEAVQAKIEINLFHRTYERVTKVHGILKSAGAKKVHGVKPDARIPGIDHKRALASKDGIFSADVVLIPLEDGDRAEALKNMGKTVIAVDLNPLSRTSMVADIAIVDNINRAAPRIALFALGLKRAPNSELSAYIKEFDNKKNMHNTLAGISKRLSGREILEP